jgi:bacteriocin biosynthesis cyclodehydratase domain-containing protein
VDGSTDLAALARYASVPVPSRPLLVPWVKPVEIGDGLIELRSPEAFYPLRNQLMATAFRAVGDRLDGAHEAEALAAQPAPGLEPTTIIFLLKMLRSLGLLLDRSEIEGDGASREQSLFLSNFTAVPTAVQRRLAAASVAVTGPEALTGRVVRRLQAVGCRRAAPIVASALERRDPPDLTIVCADAPARSYLAAANEKALRTGRPWLRAAVHSDLAWLGPLVLPGETPCLACMETRERANTRGQGAPPEFTLGSLGSSTLIDDLLAIQVAAEAARFLGGFAAPATVGGAYELSARSPEARRHTILRDPECLACGGLWVDAPRP